MKKIFTLIFSLALVQAFGQTPAIVMQVVSSAGGFQQTSNLSISWTLGEPVITTISGGSFILTQGFQQGNLLGTDIPVDPDLSSISLKIFPNPVINKVYFKVDNRETKGEFIVDIFDITGRKMITQNLGQFNNQETMDMSVSSLKSGIYLVKVTIGGFKSEMIKFIKE